MNYPNHFKIKVNWLFDISPEEAFEKLKRLKKKNTKQTLLKYAQLEVPKRLWKYLVKVSGIIETQKWAEVTNQ